MPGVSTDGIYQQVRRMTIPVANWTGAQVSGAVAYPGLNTTHGLTDGRIPTQPAWVAEQMDAFRAWVVDGGGRWWGDAESFITFSDYDLATDRVGVTVSTRLTTTCLQRNINLTGAYLEIRVLFKSPHSIEGRGVDQGENVPAVPGFSLLGGSLPGDDAGGMETIYVRTTGNDSNDGHTVATAFLTMQAAANWIMAQSPLRHSILVDVGPGTFAGWSLNGVQLVNNARIYIIGSVPSTALKTSVSGGAATIAASGRDHQFFRLTPDAAWSVAPAAADIGRTIRVQDAGGTNTFYATVANIQNNAAGWVDLNCNHTVMGGGVPAWATAANTTYTIMDETGASVTIINTATYISNIDCAGTQTTPTANFYNCIGHMRFTTAAATFESAERFAFVGVRFEATSYFWATRDCSCIGNAVHQNNTQLYFPTAIHTRLGFTNVGTVNAWGGLGWSSNIAVFQAARGGVSGLIITDEMNVTDTADVAFAWFTQYGTKAAVTNLASNAEFLYSRHNGPLSAASLGSLYVAGYNTFAARFSAADDTTANAPLNVGGGLIQVTNAALYVANSGGNRIEGRNDDHAGNVVVHAIDSKVSWTGGFDANLFGEKGWLILDWGSTGDFRSGATFAQKTAAATAPDIQVLHGSVLSSGGSWIKNHVGNLGDTAPGPLVTVWYGSTWNHGDPTNANSIYRVGTDATAGNAVDCGNTGGVVWVDYGSHVSIGNPQINHDRAAAAGVYCLQIQNGSQAAVGTNAASYMVIDNGAGAPTHVAALKVGSAAASNAGGPPVAAATQNDTGAGTEMCMYRAA